jgi:hypothetical protein
MEAYHERIRKFEESRKAIFLAAQQQTLPNSVSSRLETGRSQLAPLGTERTLLPTGTGRTALTGRESSRYGDNPQLSERQKSLTDFNATAVKSLQTSHPEVLAKYRAERAMKFVESLPNPLAPPEYNPVSTRGAFRPGGSIKYLNTSIPEEEFGRSKAHSKKGTSTKSLQTSGGLVVTARDVDTARMKESLKSLVNALQDTDQQIAKQELKIALSKKVKTYEKRDK